MLTIQPVDKIIHIDSLVTIYNASRPRGFYYPGESHDFWEIVFIQQGNVTVTADERVYQLDAGKLLIHKPWEFHRLWVDNKNTPWIVNISFCAHGDLIPKLENRCFDLSTEQQNLLFEIVKNFTKVMTFQNSPNTDSYRISLNLTANLLEMFLIDLTENEKYSTPSKSPNDERYSKIVQIMKSNCHKNLSLQQLAHLCDMSVSNMKRVFQLYSGVGIAKYFLTLKIRYAMELIDKGMPANKVAEALEFSDVAYFYTTFKRETNMTPAQYKNRKNIS